MNNMKKSGLPEVNWAEMDTQGGALKGMVMTDGFDTLTKQSSDDTRIRNEIAQEMLEHPELKNQRRSKTDSLEVINTLGFTDGGSFISVTQDTLMDAVAKGIVTVMEKGEDNADKDSFVVVKEKNGEIISGCLKKTVKGNKYVVPYQKRPDGSYYMEDASSRRKKKTVANADTSKKKKNPYVEYRVMKGVAQLVGYLVRNCGDEPLTLTTQYFKQDESGKYVEGDAVDVTLQPGEVMPMSKKYLAMNAMRWEFSGKFANGIIVSSNKKEKGDTEEVLSKYFFKFNKDTGLEVHSEDIKLPIAYKKDTATGTEWIVKDEYLPVFGTLMNKKTASKSLHGIKQEMNLDKQDILARQLRAILERTDK